MRHIRMIWAVTAAWALLALEYADAGDMEHGGKTIQLENAWARRSPALGQREQGEHGAGAMAAGNGAAYVTIKNHGSKPDTLLSVTADLADRVELHQTITRDGVMRMQPLATFDVPPGTTLEMKPGSYHLMLLGLKHDLKPGDTVALTLTFEKAGRLSLQAPVK
jgi:copper(I)-binding protein